MLQQVLTRQALRSMLGGMAVMFVASIAVAQTQPHYVGLTYIQTLPGKADEFRKFASTEMTKMGQMGVDEGTIHAYYILRLTAPYAIGSEYNYVQAVWYTKLPSLAPLDRSIWEARAKKAGHASYQEYLDKRDSLAKILHSVWRVSTARIGEVHPGNYLRSANYQVDREYRQEMARFLQEYTMPLAKARFSTGKLLGWGVTRPAAATTSDDEAGFSFSVVTVSKDSEALMSGPGAITEELFKSAVPGKSYAAYLNELNRLNQHRKSVMTRIYEVVALAGTPPEVTPAN
ncbi:MAG: hypothetical protein JST11_09190 [Acidobacteria bacterium]|nr:hypothetical protein [Acidobacteriota bacterium]